MKERRVVSVSQNAVVQAESAILGCSECAPDATVRFWEVLDNLRRRPGVEVLYILPALASCPACRARIDETTLVAPKINSESCLDEPVVHSKA